MFLINGHINDISWLFGLKNKSLVLYRRNAFKPRLNTRADVSSRVRCLVVGLSLALLPYFVNGRSEGSAESAHMRRLV